MNYLDAERTRYQNQDRYATSPEASGQETRALGSCLLVLCTTRLSRRYTRGSPDSSYRDIGELFRLNNKLID
ncbi:MAG TPA: hypothetical protein VGA80_13815 [Flavobacteriaceae bacterium]